MKNDKKPTTRPWNRVNAPVYSICSKGDAFNMNITTYVTPVSMQPKRYICGIYHGTQTIHNVQAETQFVLQLLNSSQYNLVNLLGRHTGRNTDKIGRLHKRALLTNWRGFPVLKDALALIELNIINRMEAGDHVAFLCDVTGYKNLSGGTALTLQDLRDRKIINAG